MGARQWCGGGARGWWFWVSWASEWVFGRVWDQAVWVWPQCKLAASQWVESWGNPYWWQVELNWLEEVGPG